jgi:hypothetical protein
VFQSSIDWTPDAAEVRIDEMQYWVPAHGTITQDALRWQVTPLIPCFRVSVDVAP